MPNNQLRIFPLGDSALTVEFGNVISPDLNHKAISLANHFEANRFPGFIETVPAYASATVFYDPVQVRRAFTEFPTAYEAVKELISTALKIADESPESDGRLMEILVIFDRDSEFDLVYVADENGISRDDVIDIFTSTTYRVYMLGFLPGFTYMGEVDNRIATPRKENPRTLVPKGSVGIAGKQTGIYSLESPGGWQIIGRTDVDMFTPDAESPTCLRPGDEVRFIEAK